MLSQKTKYGLKALLFLSQAYSKRPVLIEEIAGSERIPKKFLEAILLELKNRGILISKKGKGGGYSLAKSPKEVTFGQVIRSLEGPLAPVSCASQTAYRKCEDCRSEASCGIHLVMKEVRDAISSILDHKTLAEVSQIVQQQEKESFNFVI